MFDKYFRNPVKWDFLISLVLSVSVWFFVRRGIISVPNEDNLYSMLSNISATALTMVGFIFTLVTILISFKSSNKVDKNNIKPDDSVFDMFFASDLYFETTSILNNAIKSLTFVALSGYLIGLFSRNIIENSLFYYCIFGVCVILLTILRSIFILTKIIKMQTEGEEHEE